MFSLQLPVDTQARVSQYVMSKTAKPSSSAQSRNGNEIDTFDASEYEFNISASLMSKILEDSIQDTVSKHCDTCTCNKSQNKPFCYNESYYSVATQTLVSGEMKNSLCLSCNAEIKSLNSNLSMRSVSPLPVRIITDRSPSRMIHPLYILPQPTPEHLPKDRPMPIEKSNPNSIIVINEEKIDENRVITVEPNDQPDGVPKVNDLKHIKTIGKNVMSMEPAVHHKLCDRTKMSVSVCSKKSSVPSVANDELLSPKEVLPSPVEVKPLIEKGDSVSERKNSQSSMGAVSRASSVAKSTVSTHKSNTQVGPGPRFCHLRMQAGSKNILLDNAEPDVPPVLYRRQIKCNENSIFKDLTEDVDNFIAMEKNDNDRKEDIKNDNVVVESTLIDVHVDNNYKETNSSTKTTSINPALLNVSSSPLQPLKTHNFSNSSENNNNKSQSIGSHQHTTELDNLLGEFNADMSNANNNNNQPTETTKKNTVVTPTDNHDVKIFNFDRYEQNKLASQYSKPLRKIDMSQLHSLENTRISKDWPPLGNMPKLDKKVDAAKGSLPPIVNVYPNLTQTHLKVNENKKAFTNEQSTSSLSSDDSAALLQKQQLLRVAEWVEKNLELQNNFNDPLDEDVNFKWAARRDKLARLSETLCEYASLNMPHPVSKYSKSYRDAQNWIHSATQNNHEKSGPLMTTGNVIKETMFPVESGDATVTEISKDTANNNADDYNVAKDLRDSLAKSDKEISPEDLARMEYNVKKFLLSGPHWANPGSAVRSRRTSSKTETDV